VITPRPPPIYPSGIGAPRTTAPHTAAPHAIGGRR
jgi:hypothetical protein